MYSEYWDSFYVILRSINSRNRVRVVFKNETDNCRVRLLWLNFQGEEVSYGVINPKQTNPILTFLTHPWVLKVEKEDGEELEDEVFFQWPDRATLRPVFEAKKFAEILRQVSNQNLHSSIDLFLRGRKEVFVSIRTKHQVASLLKLTAKNLSNQAWASIETIKKLELPATLTNYLVEVKRKEEKN